MNYVIDEDSFLYEIYVNYGDISATLYDLSEEGYGIYADGSFGYNPIFVYYGDDSDVLEEDFDLYMNMIIHNETPYMKLKIDDTKVFTRIKSLIKSCSCLESKIYNGNYMNIKFPIIPSYKELREITSTFYKIFEIIKSTPKKY